MGSPLSPIVANLYMENFEVEAIRSAPHPPYLWKRFVDDTFTILQSSQKHWFLEHINSIDQHIQFTAEDQRSNGTMPFLDILVTPGRDEKVYHLEDTMIMHGKYNSDTLMELLKTMHQMLNVTIWRERIFVSEKNKWLKHKLADIHNEFDDSIETVLFLTTVKEKYVRMYEKFIAELKSYLKAIKILSKGYLPITLITPSKLEAILKQVQIAIA